MLHLIFSSGEVDFGTQPNWKQKLVEIIFTQTLPINPTNIYIFLQVTHWNWKTESVFSCKL